MKIWLCYAKAGGGHKAPAEALADQISKLYPQTEIKLIDLAEKAVFFIRLTIEGGYSLLIHHFSWLYVLLYRSSALPFVMKLEYKLAEIFLTPAIKARLVVDSPDGIVATHFLVSPIRAALRELKKDIPVIVVVTDPFSAPPIWFYYKDIKYVVFSEAAREIALKAGVDSENITVLPQVVNHRVDEMERLKTADFKEKNGLSRDKKLILMIGGAYGLPGGEAVLSEMLKQGIDDEIVVVCGHNEHAKERMMAVASQRINVKIFGFLNNVSEYMLASDMVIGKAGAGVVWETILSKKPLLVTYYVYGQEEGTKDFVVKNGLGWYESDPRRAAKKALEFLHNEAIFKPNMDRSKLRSGNAEVANFIFRTVSSARP